MAARPLAVITGASTGIGYELAKIAAGDGYDLIIASDEAEINDRRHDFGVFGVEVKGVRADLGTEAGVDKLLDCIGNRPVALLMANAGIGAGGAFLDQDFHRAKDVVDLNVTGTISLIHAVGRRMRARGEGRILITGSIADDIPGSFNLVYNASKAFVDSFAQGLRNELKDSGVTVTCLMPGPTDTEFFERADMLDTSVGQDEKKDDPADVAADGYRAMMAGEAGVVAGSFMNKVQSLFSNILPDNILAQMHRQMAEPKEDA